MNAFFLFITVPSSSSATGIQPFLKYTFSGVLNHSMFSLLSATVLILIKCFTPTFSDTEFPPQEPQPRVRDGASLKLYRSPMPPWEDGVLIKIRQVFIASACFAIFSFWAGCTYREAVCPYPPSATSCSAFASASSKVFALYIPSTGDSFSCANSSDMSTDSTSPIRILVSSGTLTPAIFAISYADLPGILLFRAPLMMMVLRTLSNSSPFLRK